MTLHQQQAAQAVQQAADYNATQARYSAIEHLCNDTGAAHIYKAKGGGWTLLASAGACIVGALTVGTYPTKQHAKTAANVLGLKAHNY
jgi:hypothetical protein